MYLLKVEIDKAIRFDGSTSKMMIGTKN